MGWSCRKDAGDCLDRVELDLRKYYGVLANDGKPFAYSWRNKGKRYMLEISRKEHSDGAITGTVYVYVDSSRVLPYGSLRIEGNGYITRWAGLPSRLARHYRKEFEDIRYMKENNIAFMVVD